MERPLWMQMRATEPTLKYIDTNSALCRLWKAIPSGVTQASILQPMLQPMLQPVERDLQAFEVICTSNPPPPSSKSGKSVYAVAVCSHTRHYETSLSSGMRISSHLSTPHVFIMPLAHPYHILEPQQFFGCSGLMLHFPTAERLRHIR